MVDRLKVMPTLPLSLQLSIKYFIKFNYSDFDWLNSFSHCIPIQTPLY